VAQQPTRLTQILPPPDRLQLATTHLVDCSDVAKLLPHSRLGFPTLHSIGDKLLDPLLDVKAQFRVDLLIER
jgi:hypothetical protein